MFNFVKKNAEIEEQVMEEVTDEQLDQVTGGSLLNVVNIGGILDTANGFTSLGKQEFGSMSLSGLSVQVAGISVSVPAITPSTLLP